MLKKRLFKRKWSDTLTSLFLVCNLKLWLENILVRTQNENIECKDDLLLINKKKKESNNFTVLILKILKC